MRAFGSILAMLCVLPLAAEAAIIQVDYTGTINSIAGTGLGYSLGEAISGGFYVDSNAPALIQILTSPNEDVAFYFGLDQQLVQGGHLSIDPGDSSLDTVVVIDSKIPSDSFGDAYLIANGSLLGGTIYLIESVAVQGSVNFVTGTDILQTFSVAASDFATGTFRGQITSTNDATGEYDGAFFLLSTLSVRPQSIPDPSTFDLFATGLIALGLIRRRTSA
jgi:hypothetical protein